MNEKGAVVAKIIVIGNSCVGKTCLIQKMTTNEFKSDHDVTIAVEFGTLLFKFFNEKVLKVQVWDTAGQENFKSMTKMFYRAADCILFCFDLTNRETLNSLIQWHEDVINSITDAERVVMILVGTKSDLSEEREVSEE